MNNKLVSSDNTTKTQLDHDIICNYSRVDNGMNSLMETAIALTKRGEIEWNTYVEESGDHFAFTKEKINGVNLRLDVQVNSEGVPEDYFLSATICDNEPPTKVITIGFQNATENTAESVTGNNLKELAELIFKKDEEE